VYQSLYQIVDREFIHDSYASRDAKGIHRGARRFDSFARNVTHNYSRNAFVLKCDIRKFFDCIDHDILLSFLARKISDRRLLALINKIVRSFEVMSRKGLPLGNVTSQLFANMYLNVFDQFIKHILKARFYIRYCDDFVVMHERREVLEAHIRTISDFLRSTLKLDLHQKKVSIRRLSFGTDFLGYVSLPFYTVLRTRTKRRMLKRLSCLAVAVKTKENFAAVYPILQSYFGILTHCKGRKVRKQIVGMFPALAEFETELKKAASLSNIEHGSALTGDFELK
jgi:hypothetical protein